MTLPSNFQFSQGSLQDYVDCPRRFQLKYIEQLAWPALEAEPALESENNLQQGAAFHRLVQQYLLGVSVEKLSPLTEVDPKLAFWWQNFLSSFENLDGLVKLPGSNRHPEISLTAPIGENRLVGKYDLLVRLDDQFIIYDWKTSRKQPKRDWVQVNLQTRVYPYLLVKAGSYLNNSNPIQPSQIKMVYWYANFPTSPLNIHFNDLQYYEDQKYINCLLEEISLLDGSPSEMTNDIKRCRFCVYRSLCNRGTKAGPLEEVESTEDQDLEDFDLDFEQITEIEH
jgi:CRISPR/Cas system-associated exonuclease Cas4 (RecB family)